MNVSTREDPGEIPVIRAEIPVIRAKIPVILARPIAIHQVQGKGEVEEGCANTDQEYRMTWPATLYRMIWLL